MDRGKIRKIKEYTGARKVVFTKRSLRNIAWHVAHQLPYKSNSIVTLHSKVKSPPTVQKEIDKKTLKNLANMSLAETLVVTTLQEDEELLFAVGQTMISSVPLVLKAAMELGILELLSESSAQLSPTQIASRLSIKNPDATVTIDRMLRLLVSYSFLSCTLAQDKAGRPERLYGLGPKSKFLVGDQERNVAMWFLFLMD